MTTQLYRSNKDKMLTGVAGGIGEYFAVDSTLVRIIFIAFSLAGGSGIIAYVICSLVIPLNPEHQDFKPDEKPVAQAFYSNSEARNTDKKPSRVTPSQNSLGLIFIIIGIVFLLANLEVLPFELIGRLWPLILVLIGWRILMNKNE